MSQELYACCMSIVTGINDVPQRSVQLSPGRFQHVHFPSTVLSDGVQLLIAQDPQESLVSESSTWASVDVHAPNSWINYDDLCGSIANVVSETLEMRGEAKDLRIDSPWHAHFSKQPESDQRLSGLG